MNQKDSSSVVNERWFGWRQAILWAIGLGLMVMLFKDLDFRAISKTIAGIGPWVCLALIPYAFQLVFDSMGWFRLLAHVGARTTWWTCYRIRVMSEAVLMSLPMGSVIGEGLKPYLLNKIDNVSWPVSIATVTTKKALLLLAMAIYILVAGIVGHRHLGALRLSEFLSGGMAVGILAVVLLAIAMLLLMLSGAVSGTRLLAWSQKKKMTKLEAWLSTNKKSLSESEETFARIHRSKGVLLQSTFLLLCAWMIETIETVVLLKLVGIDLAFEQVLLMEATVVVLRNLVFFLPAGLGVQDAGYFVFLAKYGVDVTLLAPSFVVLKRFKELVWIVVGYLFLSRMGLSRSKKVDAVF